MHRRLMIVVLAAACLMGRYALAMHHVTIARGDKKSHVSGKVLVQSQDGGMLLVDPSGRLWVIQADEVESQSSDSRPFAPLSPEKVATNILTELPAGFRVHKTKHYVICHDTSDAFAEWCGGLYERLYWAFYNYWTRRGFELHDPEFPMVVIAFSNKVPYTAYAAKELGKDAASTISFGYYSLQTNRVTIYDLTSATARQAGLGKARSAAQINRLLSQPGAERTVATIIHEATHQIAFNCGLHARYADIPLWLSEGMAIYFETPDLSSGKGWRGIGAVNKVRLAEFRQFSKTRSNESLQSLLIDSDRFRHPRTATDAYAEAWALNYFLIHQYPKQYVSYLKMMAAKKPVQSDSDEVRLNEFKKHFGVSLAELNDKFIRYMKTVR